MTIVDVVGVHVFAEMRHCGFGFGEFKFAESAAILHVVNCDFEHLILILIVVVDDFDELHF
jgi:hypothetical protein